MNTAIEMHDSSVLEVKVRENGSGFVLLDAVVFRSEGQPGVDDGMCGLQSVRLTFSGMTVDGEVGSDEPGIYHGSLAANGIQHQNMIPVPFSAEGSIALELMLADDARLVIVRGHSVWVQIEGEFRYEAHWRRD